ncbi:EscR/YscR/HrcR family type III secretion system export apparatus protein [Pantoea sp. Mb-10]|uniref:EscR/YscR/HrcR family type III secretion system export apparatus protein n=1 Tax=unclassified Pantoea TaxID=2630326 RepID=UPI001E5269C4|nr:EscR/YscR/HrcR family type III secretion system export apparatus protein [Pantoea sp. Mb-10]MCE0503610.1 EscR/YscR/HrcR family type III secretion system export apparatus protein [Pantoea sp. Pb-8]
MENDFSLIATLALASLAPFLLASGTCYIKFSVVFIMIRNAIGLQQVPSNLTLNGIALILASVVMMPVARQGYDYVTQHNLTFDRAQDIEQIVNEGFGSYRAYLERYADPALTAFFHNAQRAQPLGTEESEAFEPEDQEESRPSLLALLPAYALSEIKDAFMIGFYIYLPFVVIDLLISSILLTLGMMMMSPVTLSVPVKLLLFVVLDGWTLVSKSLIEQYLSISG